MNLILLEETDRVEGACFLLKDDRARHIIKVLDAILGQQLRVGMLGGQSGTGTVTAISADEVELECIFTDDPPPRANLELLLAMPRPKVMNRLWPQLAALGIDHIHLMNAARVEKSYFQSHTVQEDHYLPLLKEGLMQAGDTVLPEVSVHPLFKPFIEDACPEGRRLFADPGGAAAPVAGGERIVLAVGPEGGWVDFERGVLGELGFEAFSLGPRVLRSDTACIAALTRFYV